MPTIIETNAENYFFKEIDKASDRVVGLLASITVDNRLTAAIKSRWLDAPTGGGTIFKDLFRDGGELGAFGTRIKIGFAMGLYGEKGFKDLRLLSKIRNEFAHKMDVIKFTDQPVADFVRSLQLAYDYPVSNEQNESTLIDEVVKSQDLWRVLLAASPHGDLTQPKTKFLRTVEVLSMLLLREQNAPLVVSKPIPRF